MSDNQEPTGGLLGLAAVGMAACCGLPLLLAGGIAVSTIGLVAGSVVVIAVGVVLALWGWRRRTASHCDAPGPAAPTRRDIEAAGPTYGEAESVRPTHGDPGRPTP